MPLYEFFCRACRRRMTTLVRNLARVDEVRCQHCESADLVKLVSRFATPKSDDARLDALSDPSALAGVDENDPTSVARWMKRMGREMGEDLGEDFDQALEEAGGDAESSDPAGRDEEPGGW